MGGTLQIVKGRTKAFPRYVPQPVSGARYTAETTPFTVGDTLSARIWPGGDLPVSFSPTVAWVDRDTASFLITVDNSDSATLEVGIYKGEVAVTRGSETGTIDRFDFEVLPAPGTGETDLAFTTLQDLLDYFPTLQTLQSSFGQAQFAREQRRATLHLIDILCERWQGFSAPPQMGQPGFNAWSLGANAAGTSKWWLRQQLMPLTPDSTPPADLPDRLTTPANIIDPTLSTALLLFPEVKEIVAKYAISYVLEAQITRGDDQDWWKLATRFKREASSLFAARTFGIDLSDPQTGYASLTITGGAASLR